MSARIFYLLGKSASGKDTIFKKLMLKFNGIGFKRIVPYTTRPIRDGEVDGVDYHFVSHETFLEMLEDKQIAEYRTYNTVHGEWTYFTPILLPYEYYIGVGTLESYSKLKEIYGNDIVPVYINVDDGIRLQRALDRERQQTEPKYEEMCRRFLSDAKDFSEENLKILDSGITVTNNDLDHCVSDITTWILNQKMM